MLLSIRAYNSRYKKEYIAKKENLFKTANGEKCTIGFIHRNEVGNTFLFPVK